MPLDLEKPPNLPRNPDPTLTKISVAWWNLQNLFDTRDDPISQDLEFTVAQGWTPEVSAVKRANLAAVLNELHDGCPELEFR